jgi:hypothetical protein
MASYTNYCQYIKSILSTDIEEIEFKSDPAYNQVLENVTKNLGTEYLKKLETEFPDLKFEDMREFINLNDKYGSSIKTIFTTNKMKLLYCSPSCMRYMYHAMLVLNYLKKTGLTKVVELGSGYGGLYLAINIFAPKMGVSLDKYYMVDLEEAIELTKKYLLAHKDSIICPLEIYNSVEFEEYVKVDDALFVSNYCFTAINESERNKYVNTLVKQAPHGFITWQTCFGLNVNNANTILQKTVQCKEEEHPQTASPEMKNHYVYW